MKKLTQIIIILIIGFCLNSCQKNQENQENYINYDSYMGYNNLSRKVNIFSLDQDAKPYKLYSLEKGSYLISYPFDKVQNSSLDICSGITQVYDTKSDTLKYVIDRYFGIDDTFLSENGKYLTYVKNNLYESNIYGCSTDLIEFYQNGELKKGYSFEELFEVEPKHNTWLYENSDNRYAEKNNRYLVENDLYVITGEEEVIILDLITAKIKHRTSIDSYFEKLIITDLPYSDFAEFLPIEKFEGIPKLKDESNIISGLELILEAEVVATKENSLNSKGKSYLFWIDATINSEGDCIKVNARSYEDVLVEESNKLKKKIEAFLLQQKFEKVSVYSLKKWTFREIIDVAKKPESLAIAELEKWKKLSCELDSLHGVYIPKDIFDAHNQLDKLFDDESKEALKNGKNSHFGIGMWMRNNWGLWFYSRLACYFTERYIEHPDDMSGYILQTYYLKLNKEKKELKKLLKKLEK